MITLPYALRRVYADGREAAYALYRGDRRLAQFGCARLTQGAAAGHLSVLLGAS